jgi:hypothetical protein
MKDIAGFIAKAAEKIGFNRDFYLESNIPTDPANICVILFFGDIRSLFILSSLLLHRYKEQDKPSKYIIFASWPGFSSLFPYVDEYWSLHNDLHVKKLIPTATGFKNNNELTSYYLRNLNHYFFEDVVLAETEFSLYYNNGLTNQFWNKYKQIKRFLPEISSSVTLGKDFQKEFTEKGGYKVCVYPTTHMVNWHNNQPVLLPLPKEFWVTLVHKLLLNKIVPVICKSFATFDLSSEFNKSCICFSDLNVDKILSLMRFTGCTIDVFGFASSLAMAARTPFVSCVERAKYISLKEYEIDDLCGFNVPKKYIFSFSTIIEGGNPTSWELDIINTLVNRVNDFLPFIDKDKLPGIGQSLEFVSYDIVRVKKLKKIGTRFIKLPKDNLQWETW